jgi:hypothetical protein
LFYALPDVLDSLLADQKPSGSDEFMRSLTVRKIKKIKDDEQTTIPCGYCYISRVKVTAGDAKGEVPKQKNMPSDSNTGSVAADELEPQNQLEILAAINRLSTEIARLQKQLSDVNNFAVDEQACSGSCSASGGGPAHDCSLTKTGQPQGQQGDSVVGNELLEFLDGVFDVDHTTWSLEQTNGLSECFEEVAHSVPNNQPHGNVYLYFPLWPAFNFL